MDGITDLLIPYPKKASIDVTEQLKIQVCIYTANEESWIFFLHTWLCAGLHTTENVPKVRRVFYFARTSTDARRVLE